MVPEVYGRNLVVIASQDDAKGFPQCRPMEYAHEACGILSDDS